MLLVKPILLSILGGRHKKDHSEEEEEPKDDNFKPANAIKDKFGLHENIK